MPAFRGPASTHRSVVGAEVWEDIKNGDETGTGPMSQSIVNPCEDLAFYSKIDGNHRGALSKEHLGLA